jgi:hypothetical protein
MEYFARNGKPCPYGVWSEMLADRKYREVRVDELPNGTKVETIWLGVDGRSFYLRPRPIDRHLIFYTTVSFPKEAGRKRKNQYFRYATEREARAGHRAAVRKYGRGAKKLHQRRTRSR